MVSHSSALLVSHVCFDFTLSPWNDPFLNEHSWSSFSVGLPLTLCTFVSDLSVEIAFCPISSFFCVPLTTSEQVWNHVLELAPRGIMGNTTCRVDEGKTNAFYTWSTSQVAQ